MGANDPRGVTNLDLRGMIGRIYVRYHLTLLHTKYTGFSLRGFREEDFFRVFPIISLWQIMEHPGRGHSDPRGMVGRIMKGIGKRCYTQNINVQCLMVSEKKIFFMFFYYKSMGANDPRGVANLDPGAWLAGFK